MKKLKTRLISTTQDSEAIILLHGLARTSRSMNKAGKLLSAYGYKIVNVNYHSRKHTIEPNICSVRSEHRASTGWGLTSWILRWSSGWLSKDRVHPKLTPSSLCLRWTSPVPTRSSSVCSPLLIPRKRSFWAISIWEGQLYTPETLGVSDHNFPILSNGIVTPHGIFPKRWSLIAIG